MGTTGAADGEQAELLRVRGVVERFLVRRTDTDVEDLTQETVTRLLDARQRLDRHVWPAYAVATARNLLVSRERERDTHQRHQHRLVTADVTPLPEEQVLLAEEHDALRRALHGLPAADQELLLSHHAPELPVSQLRTVSGARAARLARARARLRVAYLVEHGRVRLPTVRCRSVLEALSTGDRRRQDRLDVGRHLLSCDVCASLCQALVARRRGLVGLNPLVWATVLAGAVWSAARRQPAQAAVAAATAVVLAGAVVTTVARRPDTAASIASTAPSPVLPAAVPEATAGTVMVTGIRLLPGLPRPLPLGPAVGTALPVQSVPSDEGFWVGSGPGHRLWVQLAVVGESAATVRAGDRVSFRGTLRRADVRFARRVGLSSAEGAAELLASGGYLLVPAADLRVMPG